MNIKKFNADLIDLAEKRIKLNQIDYADELYDEIEDDLHSAEDNFLEAYGDYLEEILDDVHERVCSGTDVLIPTAYIAKNYIRCDSTIKLNYIEKNKDHGIVCAGANNFTKIEKNPSISTNRLGGVKALECATITVIKNSIFGNFGQGVLLVEGTSAHIE